MTHIAIARGPRGKGHEGARPASASTRWALRR